MSLLRAALVIALAGSATPALAERITCESRLSGAEPCGTIAAGSTVRLSRQLSGAKCIEGRTWGTGPSNDSIWVSGGCRAVFDVQPPNGQADQDATARYDDRALPPSTDQQRPSSEPRRSSGKPEFERGYADAQRGNFEDRANSADYRAGFQAGKDERGNDERFGDARDPDADRNDVDESDDGDDGDDAYGGDERGYAERDRASEPRPDSRHDGSRYASADRLRAHARHACVDQATASRSFGREDVNTTDVRWLGHGVFEVSLDTPDGPFTCTVDRDGNIRSMSGH